MKKAAVENWEIIPFNTVSYSISDSDVFAVYDAMLATIHENPPLCNVATCAVTPFCPWPLQQGAGQSPCHLTQVCLRGSDIYVLYSKN